MNKITRVFYVALMTLCVVLMFVPGLPQKGWVDEEGNPPSVAAESVGHVYSNRWHLTVLTVREKIPLFGVFAMLVVVGITETRKKQRHTNNPSHHTAESRAEARLPAAGER